MPGEEILLCVTAGFAAAGGWIASKMGYKVVKEEKPPTGDASSSEPPVNPSGAAAQDPSLAKA